MDCFDFAVASSASLAASISACMGFPASDTHQHSIGVIDGVRVAKGSSII
jgi:hypothetical protein